VALSTKYESCLFHASHGTPAARYVCCVQTLLLPLLSPTTGLTVHSSPPIQFHRWWSMSSASASASYPKVVRIVLYPSSQTNRPLHCGPWVCALAALRQRVRHRTSTAHRLERGISPFTVRLSHSSYSLCYITRVKLQSHASLSGSSIIVGDHIDCLTRSKLIVTSSYYSGIFGDIRFGDTSASCTPACTLLFPLSRLTQPNTPPHHHTHTHKHACCSC
jgi:hypothetical protein